MRRRSARLRVSSGAAVASRGAVSRADRACSGTAERCPPSARPRPHVQGARGLLALPAKRAMRRPTATLVRLRGERPVPRRASASCDQRASPPTGRPTLSACRKSSPSRTRSPPSSRASATACSTRCATGCSCTISLRGNRLTLEGDDEHVAAARAVVDELVELVEGGHEIGPDTVGAVARRARPGRGHPRGLRRRRLAPPRQEDRAEDGEPEALRRRDPQPHGHVRDRPGGHRQDLPRDGARRRRARREAGRPDHPHAPRGRGGRAARLPARRHAREGRPVPAAALRRALRHARRRQADRATWSAARSRWRRSRSCAAGRSTTPSSSSTRRRTPRRSRCRCS